MSAERVVEIVKKIMACDEAIAVAERAVLARRKEREALLAEMDGLLVKTVSAVSSVGMRKRVLGVLAANAGKRMTASDVHLSLHKQIPKPTIYTHLATLCQDGLVERQAKGVYVYQAPAAHLNGGAR